MNDPKNPADNGAGSTGGSAFWSDMSDDDVAAFYAHSEALPKEWENMVATYLRTKKLSRATNSELRLLCGELTSQEIRTIRAVLNFILPNPERKPEHGNH